MRCAVLCLLLTASVVAQQTAKVSGTVTSAGGNPLRKAEVILRRMASAGERNLLVVSDSEGRFVFPSVEPGRYAVTAQKAGYLNSSSPSGPGGKSNLITLAAGQELTGITLKLLPQGVIAGRVTDEDGDPLQHVSVQVAVFRNVLGKRQLVSRGGGLTNDIGEYRIANLPPGKFYVYATQPHTVLQGFESVPPVEENYPVTFYPNVLEPAQAAMLECTPGNEVRGIDFRLRKVRTFHIRGQIMDYVPSGKAGPHFAIYATRTSSALGLAGMNGATQVKPDGTFDVAGLVPGSYMLIAMRMVHGFSTNANVPVEVGNSNVDGLSITIGDGINLRGALKFESAENPDYAKIRVMIEPVDNILMGAPNSQPAKADGTFEIAGASPGRYRVNAYGLPPNSYVKSVKAGQQEVIDSGLDLTNGAAPGDLEVTLSNKAASVSGAVVDERQQRAVGTTVLLIPVGAHRGQFRYTRRTATDQSGAFSVTGVIPGEYLAFAVDGMEEGSWEDPEFLQRYESKGVKLKLGEAASENVQLTLLAVERTTP